MPFSADDLLVPGAMARLADALDADPAAAAAWGDLESFGAASPSCQVRRCFARGS